MWYAVIFVLSTAGQPYLYIAPQGYFSRADCLEATEKTEEIISEYSQLTVTGCSFIAGRSA